MCNLLKEIYRGGRLLSIYMLFKNSGPDTVCLGECKRDNEPKLLPSLFKLK